MRSLLFHFFDFKVALEVCHWVLTEALVRTFIFVFTLRNLSLWSNPGVRYFIITCKRTVVHRMPQVAELILQFRPLFILQRWSTIQLRVVLRYVRKRLLSSSETSKERTVWVIQIHLLFVVIRPEWRCTCTLSKWCVELSFVLTEEIVAVLSLFVFDETWDAIESAIKVDLKNVEHVFFEASLVVDNYFKFTTLDVLSILTAPYLVDLLHLVTFAVAHKLVEELHQGFGLDAPCVLVAVSKMIK